MFYFLKPGCEETSTIDSERKEHIKITLKQKKKLFKDKTLTT